MVKAKLFVTYDEMVCTMMGRKKENGTNPWIQKRGDRERKKKEKSKKIYDAGSPEIKALPILTPTTYDLYYLTECVPISRTRGLMDKSASIIHFAWFSFLHVCCCLVFMPMKYDKNK
jgi:hypothetical protein